LGAYFLVKGVQAAFNWMSANIFYFMLVEAGVATYYLFYLSSYRLHTARSPSVLTFPQSWIYILVTRFIRSFIGCKECKSSHSITNSFNCAASYAFSYFDLTRLVSSAHHCSVVSTIALSTYVCVAHAICSQVSSGCNNFNSTAHISLTRWSSSHHIILGRLAGPVSVGLSLTALWLLSVCNVYVSTIHNLSPFLFTSHKTLKGGSC